MANATTSAFQIRKKHKLTQVLIIEGFTFIFSSVFQTLRPKISQKQKFKMGTMQEVVKLKYN